MRARARRPAPATPESRDRSAAEDAREVEWQLAATDLDAVAKWLERHGRIDGFIIGKRPAQEIHDTYLDTAHWHIWRAGFALRIREKDGEAEATLKGLRSARSDVADRREITESLPKAGLPALKRSAGPVSSRVWDVVGEHSLRPLFQLRTSRRRFSIRGGDTSEELGEIALDRTVFSTPEPRPERALLRVEVEAFGKDASKVLEPLVSQLRAECGLEHGGFSKFAAGVRAAGLAPPPLDRQRPPAPIERTSRIDHIALRAITAQLADWEDHEPGARLGDDPEELHALRIAARRMEAVLATFAPWLPAQVQSSRRRLKSLLGTLGEVRDLDVLGAEIEAFTARLPASQRPEIEPLARHLRAERAKARSRMLRSLGARPTQECLERLSTLASGIRQTLSGSGATRATAVFPDLIRTRYRRLRKRVRRLRPDAPMSDYHALRVRTKKLRYALETCASLYGRPAGEMLQALRRFQSRLGRQQDACVITRVLLRLATHPPAGMTAGSVFLMGRLAERHSREAVRMAPRIERDWRRLEGRRWKSLLERLAQFEDRIAASPGRSTAHLTRSNAAGQGKL